MMGDPTEAVYDEELALSPEPHQVDPQQPSFMQTVFVCEIGKRTTCAQVSARSTFRDILFQHLRYAANSLHLFVLQIRNRCLSIDQMVADYIDLAQGTIQLYVYLRKKGGTLSHLIGASEGQNFPTDNFAYILPNALLRARSNAHANAADSNIPVAEEETERFEYIFPLRNQGNTPADEETNEGIGDPRQQNVPSQTRILDLLQMSPKVKDVQQKETNNNRKRIRGKKDQLPAQPATQNAFPWDQRLIFKDRIHLLSTGYNTPVIEFWSRVQILTVCIFQLFL